MQGSNCILPLTLPVQTSAAQQLHPTPCRIHGNDCCQYQHHRGKTAHNHLLCHIDREITRGHINTHTGNITDSVGLPNNNICPKPDSAKCRPQNTPSNTTPTPLRLYRDESCTSTTRSEAPPIPAPPTAPAPQSPQSDVQTRPTGLWDDNQRRLSDDVLALADCHRAWRLLSPRRRSSTGTRPQKRPSHRWISQSEFMRKSLSAICHLSTTQLRRAKYAATLCAELSVDNLRSSSDHGTHPISHTV